MCRGRRWRLRPSWVGGERNAWMSAKILLLVALVTIGCRGALTNAEIVSETKFCESNGMRAVHYSSGLGFETVRIECAPKKYCEDKK